MSTRKGTAPDAGVQGPAPLGAVESRAIWIMTLCTALALVGDNTVYAALPAMHGTLGIGATQVGLLLSINRLVRPPLNILSGALTSRIDPRWLYRAGLAIGACSTVTSAHFTSSSSAMICGRAVLMPWPISGFFE